MTATGTVEAPAGSAPPEQRASQDNLRIVARKFDGAGQERLPGEVVDIGDATRWRNAAVLEELRYLRPLGAAAKPVTCSCSRMFVDAVAMQAHQAVQHSGQRAAPPRAPGGRRTRKGSAE